MHRLFAREGRPRWLVVDHYELDATWEREVASQGILVCAIDDLADRSHDCDLLLDATLDRPARYDTLVPSRTRRFLGLKYAPLREAFMAERARARVRSGRVERVLVFYGGVDWSGESLKAIAALRAVEGDFTIDVVAGALNPRLRQLQGAIAADPRAQLRAGESEMASLTASADLAFGAIGTAMWERCFVGCPAVVTATLEKTRKLGPELAESGAIEWLGFAPEITDETIRLAASRLIQDPDHVREMGARAFALANGYVEARLEFIRAFA
jgi:UDP-2,4-diacetamido-2,4,6-trideoxy-beta-L-altropyranose hydrolase